MGSERDRLAYRAWQEELAAEEAVKREAKERPIREATEQANKLHQQIRSTVRERLLTQRDVDDLGRSIVYVSPTIAGLDMPWDDAIQFITDEYRAFALAESAWYYDSIRNRSTVLQYLERNGFGVSRQHNAVTWLYVIDAATLKAAALRLNEYGALEDRPAPEPELIEPERPYVNLSVEPAPQPITHEGWDVLTGEPRTYTEREVRRMSSLDYRKAFRLYRSALALPNQGPGPTGHRS